MCGIFCHAGEGSADVEAGLRAIAHRGPDHSGTLCDGVVSLGHQRLSIIDVSIRGNQPMKSVSGRTAIVFNGEIYNYKELKHDLELEGVLFTTESDTEVILEGYERYGAAFFERMRGMWSFVLHDIRNRKLIFTRDPFGIKPLYYAIRNRDIYFASELRCFKAAGVSLEPDPAAYDLFYALGYFVAPATPYKNVWKLRPGTVMVWDVERASLAESARIARYAASEIALPALRTEKEAIDALDETLSRSLEAHYVSDVPVSILLSGGTDSSLIAALSKKLGKHPTAYHVGIPGSEDTAYATRIARELDLPLTVQELPEEALKKQYAKMWDIIDEPTGDLSIIPTSLIYERIKGESKVVLSGEGGDELFGGYLRNRTLSRHHRVSSTNALNALFNSAMVPNSFGLSYVNPLIQRIRRVLLGHSAIDDLVGAYLASVRIIDYPIADLSVRSKLAALYEAEYDPRMPPPLAFDALAYLPNDLLQKSDIASMTSSIEARVPFVDRQVQSEVAAILESVGIQRATDDKWILKKVLERYLPRDLVYRSKKGFSVPLGAYDLRAFIDDFDMACAYHLAHREAFAVGTDIARLITPQDARRIIARKYPRFAFALISNWKCFANR